MNSEDNNLLHNIRSSCTEQKVIEKFVNIHMFVCTDIIAFQT